MHQFVVKHVVKIFRARICLISMVLLICGNIVLWLNCVTSKYAFSFIFYDSHLIRFCSSLYSMCIISLPSHFKALYIMYYSAFPIGPLFLCSHLCNSGEQLRSNMVKSLTAAKEGINDKGEVKHSLWFPTEDPSKLKAFPACEEEMRKSRAQR